MYRVIKKEATIKGGQIPRGSISVSGAKNSATRLLAAAMIADNEITFMNFPTQLIDVEYKIEFIRTVGGEVLVKHDEDKLVFKSFNFQNVDLQNYETPVRTTYLLAAGLLKRNGIARIPYPAGCKIGNRGYDLHIMVWEKLGATVNERENYIEISAPYGLKGGEIEFPINTIGGTENALICAATINGLTTIKNAYISPEVEDLIIFLQSMGAEIEADGNSFIKIRGKTHLHGTSHRVIPDRIEVITWLVYGIISGGDINICNVPFEKMEIPLIHLKECGIDFYRSKNCIHIHSKCLKNGVIQPFELATGTYPGIISDMQPFYTLLGIYADGTSRIHDYRYPERVKYCAELNKLYPNQIKWKDGEIATFGRPGETKNKLQNTQTFYAKDLRGSMAILLAALTESGNSKIKDFQFALRGYNNLTYKLNQLGIKINIEDQN